MISLEKCKILTPLQKLPMNVGNLGKIIVQKALKSFPKCNDAKKDHDNCRNLCFKITTTLHVFASKI